VQRQIGQWAVIVVGNRQQSLNAQAIVATDERIVGMIGHGVPPAENGRGNPLPGIEPRRVDEMNIAVNSAFDAFFRDGK